MEGDEIIKQKMKTYGRKSIILVCVFIAVFSSLMSFGALAIAIDNIFMKLGITLFGVIFAIFAGYFIFSKSEEET